MQIGDKVKYFPGTHDALPALNAQFLLGHVTYVHPDGTVNISAHSAFGSVQGRSHLAVKDAPDGSVDGGYVVAFDQPATTVDATEAGTLTDGAGHALQPDLWAVNELQQQAQALQQQTQVPAIDDPEEATKNKGGTPEQATELAQGTVTYSDGTSATGTLPLPNVSAAQQEALMAGTVESVIGADGTTVTKDMLTSHHPV